MLPLFLAQTTMFVDLCRAETTPACTVYLAGFVHALSAQKQICLPQAPEKIDFERIRRNALSAIRERGQASEGAVMIGTIAVLYPCKEK